MNSQSLNELKYRKSLGRMVEVVYSRQLEMADYSNTKWRALYYFHYLNYRTHSFESCRTDMHSRAC